MFCVLFYIVVSLNVLNCKKDDKIELSLTKKEAAFVLDVLSSSIQNGTEEPGQDYKSDDSDDSPNSDDMVEGTDALLHTVPTLVASQILMDGPLFPPLFLYTLVTLYRFCIFSAHIMYIVQCNNINVTPR